MTRTDTGQRVTLSPGNWLTLIGMVVAIVGAVGASYMSLREQVASMESQTTVEIREIHRRLDAVERNR